MGAKTRVGISGWTFPPWRGTFYPDDLTQKDELSYASRKLNSIEINGTFYSLQRPETFRSWAEQTPDDFVFAVKAPQYITHVRRLKECEEPLANFLASGLLCLGKKLGPILWQFPPFVMLKDDRFERFMELLPRTSEQAARLARKHGPKVEGRAFTKPEESFPLRHAFEMRHKSFDSPEFLALLKEHGAAFVTAHAAERGPFVEETTADFCYYRLHGEGPKYKKGYPGPELSKLATQVKRLERDGRDVFVYFSNEAKVYSPAGALKLSSLLKITAAVSKPREASARPRRTKSRRSTSTRRRSASG